MRRFIVMMLAGPNARLDFHYEPGEEFFYQIEGAIDLHLKPEGAPREVVTIREGEMFVCPGQSCAFAAARRRHVGLVIERKRKVDEKESFLWFCERCDALVLARDVTQADVAAQVAPYL
jgi:3-hydroxyanthranilate 3,4-dioxygenase